MKALGVVATAGLVVATALAPVGAAAQTCADDESTTQCLEQVYHSPVEGARQGPIDRVFEQLRRLATGAASFDADFRNSIKDYLGGLGGGISLAGGEGEAVGVQYNARFVGASTLQIQALFESPTISETITESIADSVRDMTTEVLEGRLRDVDDLRFTLGVEFLGRRQYGSHLGTVREVLAAVQPVDDFAAILARFQATLPEATMRAEAARICPTLPANTALMSFEMHCLGAARPGVEAAIETAARAAASAAASYEVALHMNRFFLLPGLISNEGQASLSFEYRARRDLVGQDLASGRLRFEAGFENMKKLERECPSITAVCYRGFFTDDRLRSLQRGSRLAFELSGSVRTGSAFVDVPLGLDVTEPGKWEWSASATWGANVGIDPSAREEPRGRVDVSLGFKQFLDDDLRNDHGTASATYTHSISEGVDISVGFKLANKAELLDDIDWPFTTLAGLSYSISR